MTQFQKFFNRSYSDDAQNIFQILFGRLFVKEKHDSWRKILCIVGINAKVFAKDIGAKYIENCTFLYQTNDILVLDDPDIPADVFEDYLDDFAGQVIIVFPDLESHRQKIIDILDYLVIYRMIYEVSSELKTDIQFCITKYLDYTIQERDLPLPRELMVSNFKLKYYEHNVFDVFVQSGWFSFDEDGRCSEKLIFFILKMTSRNQRDDDKEILKEAMESFNLRKEGNYIIGLNFLFDEERLLEMEMDLRMQGKLTS